MQLAQIMETEQDDKHAHSECDYKAAIRKALSANNGLRKPPQKKVPDKHEPEYNGRDIFTFSVKWNRVYRNNVEEEFTV